jgi:hypothetical protein
MNGTHAHLLDAYLDGLLSADARSTFESELHRSPGLQQQIAIQRVLDDRLRNLFAIPAIDQVLNSALAAVERHTPQAPASAAARRPKAFRTVLTLAATLAIAAIAIYRIGGFLNKPAADGRYVRNNPETMDGFYHRKIAEGFRPEWKCEDDQEFMRSFRHQLFQPLILMTPPPGHSMGGLGYANILSRYSMYMLAHVGEDRVVVFVDRVDADRNLPALSDPRLKRFRREVGELVLYEVTPLDEPRFLELFQIPPP